MDARLQVRESIKQAPLPKWAHKDWHIQGVSSVISNPGKIEAWTFPPDYQGIPLFAIVEHLCSTETLPGWQLWTKDPIVVRQDDRIAQFLTLGELIFLEAHPEWIPRELHGKKLLGLASCCRSDAGRRLGFYFPESCPTGHASRRIVWNLMEEPFDPQFSAIVRKAPNTMIAS